MQPLAAAVSAARKPVADDNPLLALQTTASEQITTGLDAYRAARDRLEEQVFFGFYGSPFVQALLGINADSIVRPVPITSSEKLAARQAQTDAYEAMLETGGVDEALTRAVLYVLAANRMLDQRCALALNVARQQLMRLSLAEFKILVRDQYFVLQLEPERAVEVLPSLVPDAEARKELLEQVRAIIAAGDPPTTAEDDRLGRLSRLLALPIAKRAASAPPGRQAGGRASPNRTPCCTETAPALSECRPCYRDPVKRTHGRGRRCDYGVSVMAILSGKKGLIIGVANEHSLAHGCALHFRAAGADVAITYLNAKAEPFVRPLAEALNSDIVMPCDVTVPGQLEAVYQRIMTEWGRLDFVLHSIAYARKEDLHGRITDCSAEGFGLAMQVSVQSFLEMAKLSEPLMTAGGCLLAMSYYGAEKAIAHYNIMGPVKAALEAAVRYMAVELGQAGIRVNALSPGPLKTRAASGIDHFDELLERAVRDAPEHRLVTLDDVGAYAAFLVSDAAKAITGNIAYVDAGYHVVA